MLRGLGVLVHPSLRNVGLKAAQRAWAVYRSWREPQAAPGEAGRFGVELELPAGLWLLLKPPKGSALPCDGETALGALAQFCGCQLRMMRLKARPLVFTAERGGRKWMFSLGLSRGDKRNNRSRKSQEGK